MSDDAEPGLIKDEVTLPDGRYLIYYTFNDASDSVNDAAKGADGHSVILSLSKDEPTP